MSMPHRQFVKASIAAVLANVALVLVAHAQEVPGEVRLEAASGKIIVSHSGQDYEVNPVTLTRIEGNKFEVKPIEIRKSEERALPVRTRSGVAGVIELNSSEIADVALGMTITRREVLPKGAFYLDPRAEDREKGLLVLAGVGASGRHANMGFYNVLAGDHVASYSLTAKLFDKRNGLGYGDQATYAGVEGSLSLVTPPVINVHDLIGLYIPLRLSVALLRKVRTDSSGRNYLVTAGLGTSLP